MKQRLPTALLNAFFITLIFIVTSQGTNAQDIEEIPEKKPVEFSGSLSLRMTSYTSNRESEYRDPFMWTLSGSPTLSLYGITFPFSFAVSNKNRSFSQPFNQYGMSPYYKWFTLHAGYRNLTFSNYTLNGHTILGAGFEANPSIFRVGFIYGRLRKANELSVNPSGNFLAPYKRNGFAAKFGIGDNSNYVDLIVVKAKDDSTSVETQPDNLNLQPAENLVVGLKSRQRFFNSVYLNVDYGFSVYTSDMASPLLNEELYNVPGILSTFYDVRQSTRFNMAGKGSLSFRIKSIRLQLKYLRIEPEYQSMGSYFINNDRENITVAPSFYLFKRKLRINGSVGYQRNNLLKDKINQTKRWVNSVNMSFVPSPKVNINASYSNYQVNQRKIFQPIDTTERRDRIEKILDSLQLQQFSQNLNVNTNFNLGNKDHRHNLNLNVNYQIFNNETMAYQEDMYSETISPNASYSYSNNVSNYGLRLNLNANSFKTNENENFRFGVTAGMNKSFNDDKIKTTFSISQYSNQQDDVSTSNTFRMRGKVNMNFADQHRVFVNGNYMSRTAKSDIETSFSEFLVTFGYSFSLK